MWRFFQKAGDRRSTYRQLGAVQEHLDAFGGAGDVVRAPRQQRHRVAVQRLHLKFGQIRLEGDAGEVVSAERLDFGLARTTHVVEPRLQKGKHKQLYSSYTADNLSYHFVKCIDYSRYLV